MRGIGDRTVLRRTRVTPYNAYFEQCCTGVIHALNADWRSTEPVTLFAPKRLTRLKGGSPAVALFGMTNGRGHIYLGLFARICVAIILLWWWLCVLEATLNLAPTLFGFSALSTISIDALFCEIIGAAAGEYEDSPAITD